MHRVTKTVDFCYGHRLVDYDGKCRHLHGHNGRLEVDVESDYLDDLGMVVDFGEVRDVVKEWIDSTIDHRMILSDRDPLLATLRDAGEPLFVMSENPTAENIAKVVFEVAQENGLNVTEVRLWETPSSYATYSGGAGDAQGDQ